MNQMPSLALLQSSVAGEFRLEDERGNATSVILQSAQAGVAMSERFSCYSAVFLLPIGISVNQGTYRLRHPEGSSWELFLVPIMPTAHGQHRLEMTIHGEADLPQHLSASAGR